MLVTNRKSYTTSWVSTSLEGFVLALGYSIALLLGDHCTCTLEHNSTVLTYF